MKFTGRDAAARFGLNIGDIQDAIETAVAGKTTSELWEGERHFSVVLRLAAKLRSLDALPKLLVGAPSDAQVPLGQPPRVTMVVASLNLEPRGHRKGKTVARYGQSFKSKAVARLLPPTERCGRIGGAADGC